MNRKSSPIEVHFSCPFCQGSNQVYLPTRDSICQCDSCSKEILLHGLDESKQSHDHFLHRCPLCLGEQFYRQKDFNRRVGLVLFLVAAILSIWTYGLSFVILYLGDFLLFKRLREIVICYGCETIFRRVTNVSDFSDFDHEIHDRLAYGETK